MVFAQSLYGIVGSGGPTHVVAIALYLGGMVVALLVAVVPGLLFTPVAGKGKLGLTCQSLDRSPGERVGGTQPVVGVVLGIAVIDADRVVLRINVGISHTQ